MSDTGTISQELINKVAHELATLKAERDELREALQRIQGVLNAEGWTRAERERSIAAWQSQVRALLAKGKG